MKTPKPRKRTTRASKPTRSAPATEDELLEPGKKSERTRARILEAAFALFSEKGYEHTSMRDVAARAGCAVGLIYRYFRQREDFAMALYLEQAARVEVRAQALCGTTVAERFAEIMHARVDVAAPHRAALRGLVAASLERTSPVSVFAPETAEIRESVKRVLGLVVYGAVDRPPSPLDAQLVEILFVVQLFVLLVCTQDDSEGCSRTHTLVDTVSDALRTFGPMLPLGAPMVAQLSELVRSFAPTSHAAG